MQVLYDIRNRLSRSLKTTRPGYFGPLKYRTIKRGAWKADGSYKKSHAKHSVFILLCGRHGGRWCRWSTYSHAELHVLRLLYVFATVLNVERKARGVRVASFCTCAHLRRCFQPPIPKYLVYQ